MLLFGVPRSAPEFPGGGGGAGGGVAKRKTFLQPLDHAPSLESTRVQLLDPLNESEVEMILHPPPDEDTEVSPRGMTRHPAISEESEPASIQKVESVRESAIKGGSPIKRGSPIKNKIVDDSLGVSISQENVLIKEVTPPKAESESKEGAVMRREGASERRQLRRIRTNSQVETII